MKQQQLVGGANRRQVSADKRLAVGLGEPLHCASQLALFVSVAQIIGNISCVVSLLALIGRKERYHVVRLKS